MRVESEARQAKTGETGWEGTPGHCDGDDDGGECGDDNGDNDGDGNVIFHHNHSRRLPSCY